MKAKKKTVIVGILFGLALLTPPIAYLIVFWGSPISKDPGNWGVLGDYLGGILNPIISPASLGILGYLTYLVSQQSVKESKKLFILEKRMEAYQDLTKYIKEINMVADNISKSSAQLSIVENIPVETRGEPLLKIIEEMVTTCSVFKEFYFTLTTFQVKYSHLFEYDFSSQEFIELTEETKVMKERFDRIIKKFTGQIEFELQASDLILSERFQELIQKVVNKIRKEVITKDTE